MGPLGASGAAAAGAGGHRGPGHRGLAGSAGHAAQRQRGADEELPGHRHGHRRPPDAGRRRHQPRGDEAAGRAGGARRRPGAHRRTGACRARRGRRGGGPRLVHGAELLVEAFATIDGAAPGIQGTIDRTKAALVGTGGIVTGVAAVDRDFLHALFGSFPYVVAVVLLLTMVLLTRAFRSPVLAFKAVFLNLLSLGAAFGVVVLIFQQGHGSALWGISATQSVIAWIPVMIFAFLFGLSMDYEVFMLSRMREAYDETGSTDRAIELGLARTGKLVTSGALVLMLSFVVLSTSPGYEVKPMAIGLAAGIILDATVIRALLVPAVMRLLGDANWWMPEWVRNALRLARLAPAPTAAPENA
ncbi:MAG: MMPL family transporter [Thermoleophilia bacterium]